MALVQQEVNKPQQARFVGFSMWQWEGRGRLWDVVSVERVFYVSREQLEQL